jgi:F0F1-type ATP synthase gamma subunit
MKEGLNRGLKEIEKTTGESINCFYHKVEKKFVFGWEQISKYPSLRIPYKRIDEFISWYLEHNNDKLHIKSIDKYKQGLKNKIIKDEFLDLDKWYRGMMQHKYNLNYKNFYEYGKYKDFKPTVKQNTLF